VYVPQAGYLEPGYSGDHVFVRSLVGGLRKRGHQVTIASRLDPADFAHGRVAVRGLVTEAISVRKRMSRFSPDVWLTYAPSEDRPDLFGSWQRPKKYLLVAANAPRGKHTPGDWRSAFLAFAHKRSLARANKMTAFHRPSADRLRSFGIRDERICVLPPAAEAWEWMPSREEARRRLALPQETPVILCIARFSVRKHPGKWKPKKTDMILDLMAVVAPILSDVLLVIVGDGVGRQQLEDAAFKLKPEGHVRLVGAVQHDEDLRWYYAASDFYAYPDTTDRVRLSILEAQYCGRPVVTMRTPAAELTVVDGHTGLLAKDLEELRAHATMLAGDKVLCEAMGRAAREFVAAHHSMEIRIRQIEDLLLNHD
jgi:glycosyltransferase involved in cell wall biosynthesis